MGSYTLTDEGDQWLLRFNDYSIFWLGFDYGVTFTFGSPADANFGVRIDNSFSFTDAEVTHFVSLEDDQNSLCVLLALRNRSVNEVSMSKQGTLNIRFGEDASVTVEADQQYEAWQINMPNGMSGEGSILREVEPTAQARLIVCSPGGGLTFY